MPQIYRKNKCPHPFLLITLVIFIYINQQSVIYLTIINHNFQEQELKKRFYATCRCGDAIIAVTFALPFANDGGVATPTKKELFT